MPLFAILSVLYIIGFNISYWMLSTEHKAEGLVYTIGDRIICLLLSLLSWLTIAWCLVSTWITKINKLKYWDKPVEETAKVVNELKRTA